MFWLVHSNTDRIHESYLAFEKDSQKEFKADGKRAEEEGGENEYENPLIPFVNPATGRYYVASELFDMDSTPLKIRYDRLIDPPKQELNEVPVQVVFLNVDINILDCKSYKLLVFMFHDQEDG